VNRYPVYVRDIAPTGVECLEIHGRLSSSAVARAAKLLEDPGLWRDSAERNYQIGRRHFSFAVVRERFLPLIEHVAPCYGEQAAAVEASAQ
jgi:DNA-binding IclR family transcriptional regulator